MGCRRAIDGRRSRDVPDLRPGAGAAALRGVPAGRQRQGQGCALVVLGALPRTGPRTPHRLRHWTRFDTSGQLDETRLDRAAHLIGLTGLSRLDQARGLANQSVHRVQDRQQTIAREDVGRPVGRGGPLQDPFRDPYAGQPYASRRRAGKRSRPSTVGQYRQVGEILVSASRVHAASSARARSMHAAAWVGAWLPKTSKARLTPDGVILTDVMRSTR